ncbi:MULTISPECIES: alpha/beta fold hydrolase [Pseudomonas syringae group]|uniref:Esterase/lipase/thioesterase family protein n=2 Tax=Pseudomonas syringae group TaxID=136849 RepID=A0ABY1UBE4_PSESX|nr:MULTISPECIES: alpha/beta fold hydrolase [Pseudomonas syringae group]KWT12612.1 EstX protein [Pseudomonas syringae pv. avii]PHN65752.1 EstX protein [Pseudomonas syringae]POQ08638.1 alpha/beta hydrolase [Pseudomonas syringae pv. avii]RMR17954.1 Esterase/lipase/thioesterase protein [Pseudomonas syringae pv. persicae]SOQ11056.1 esterase/lipase/thioesterase family protein [Pseudomonas syringae pv. persicae]
MQSSSQLFPVALISAERRGDLVEDVYRLKPANSPDPSVELVVTRLGLVDQPATRGVPVILLHGSFSNRRFWYSPKGIGLGPYLARAGYDVWIPEMRGHGLSSRNQNYRANCVADYARFDLPAIGAFVVEQSGQAPHWIGHSLGGTTLAAALGGQYLGPQNAASVALFGSQVSRSYWPLKIPPLQWSARLLLRSFTHVSGPRFKRGPEDEPVGLVLESLRWQGLFGRFGERDNHWWAGLCEVQVPVLAVAAVGDQQDPEWACRMLFDQIGGDQPKQFLCLGREHGFSEDFGHVQMLVSKAAQQQVWPRVIDWLRERSVPEQVAEFQVAVGS